MTTDFSDLRQVDVADVYKAGALAAILRRESDSTVFEYVDDYLIRSRVPVATTLPLTDEARVTAAGSVPPFFAGLLPEGHRLSSLRRAVKTSADDEFSLLLAIGEDTPGDVQIVPHGQEPKASQPQLEFSSADWFGKIRFTELLTESGVVDRVALPGVQDKVSARMISVPVTVDGGDFILKIDPPEFKNASANEYFFNGVAKRSKLQVADVELVHDAEGNAGLLSTRFDRTIDDDGVLRSLGFEDACQLLDRWPADKYSMASEQVIEVIAKVCSASKLAIREALRQFVFAWVTGNGDLHSKNIGVLSAATGEWQIAPAYDIPSTVPYGDTTLALSLAGKTSGLSRKRMATFATAVGLTERVFDAVVDDILRGTADLVDRLEDRPFPMTDQQQRNLIRTIRFRRQGLAG